MASGSSANRSSTPVASVGQMSDLSMPMSFMRVSRGSGSKKASTDGMPRRCWGSASDPPGGATRAKVGLGMKSLILSLNATLVRLLISTYLTMPSNSARDEFRQGIGVLVHVVVGVEHRVGQVPLAHVDERIGHVLLSHGPPSTADRRHAAPCGRCYLDDTTHCWADAQKPKSAEDEGIQADSSCSAVTCGVSADIGRQRSPRATRRYDAR